MKKTSFVKLFLLTSSFYMAILVVPFTMTVIGYRTPYSKAVLWGMVAGFVANVAWKLCDIEFIESIIPAMIANFVVLVLMHKYYHSKEQNNIHKKLDVV